VKLRAIENMHEAGIEIILVITLVNGVNNDQVGPIVNFARENPKKIAFVAFQPVSFTGRDEEVTPERRLPTLHAAPAHDVKKRPASLSRRATGSYFADVVFRRFRRLTA
jgi:molybdenum cofactor biosynthesis enzyme MoaA